MYLTVKTYLIITGLFLIGYIPVYRALRPELKALVGPRYVASFAILILAGLTERSPFLFQFTIAIVFLATVRTRQEAICRYVMLIVLIPSPGYSLVVGSAYLGSFSNVTTLSFAMLAAMAMLPDPDRPRRRPRGGFLPEDALAIVICLIFTVCSSRFVSPSDFARTIVRGLADYILPYYVLRANIRTPEQFKQIVGCFAIAAISLATEALFEAGRGWAPYDMISQRLSPMFRMAASFERRGGSIRASGPFGAPLLLAYYFVLSFVTLACSRSYFKKTIVWQGAMVLMFVAVFTPQSRGALLALVPASIVLLATRKRYGAAVAALAVSALGGAMLYVLKSSSARVAAFMGEQQRFGAYYDYRQILLQRGMQEGMKHPIFGRQLNLVLDSLADITQGQHIVDLVNTYLTMFLVSGIVGMGAFAILTAIVIRRLIGRAKRGGDLEAVRDDRAMLLAAWTATLIYIFGVSFTGLLPVFMLLLLAGSAVTSVALVRRRTGIALQRPAADVAELRTEAPVSA